MFDGSRISPIAIITGWQANGFDNDLGMIRAIRVPSRILDRRDPRPVIEPVIRAIRVPSRIRDPRDPRPVKLVIRVPLAGIRAIRDP